MTKDGAVIFMTFLFLVMAGVIMIFGVVEKVRYSGFEHTTVDKNTSVIVIGGKS